MPNLLAHGFQTLVHTAPRAGLFPYLVEESLVSFLEQSSRFLKPVYADDTIYPALEVTELTPGRSTGVVTLRSTVHNQRANWCWKACRNFCFAAGRREAAPPHSITSSAMASRFRDTSMPSSFAVLRLITVELGRLQHGISAGFAPLRIWPL